MYSLQRLETWNQNKQTNNNNNKIGGIIYLSIYLFISKYVVMTGSLLVIWTYKPLTSLPPVLSATSRTAIVCPQSSCNHVVRHMVGFQRLSVMYMLMIPDYSSFPPTAAYCCCQRCHCCQCLSPDRTCQSCKMSLQVSQNLLFHVPTTRSL